MTRKNVQGKPRAVKIHVARIDMKYRKKPIIVDAFKWDGTREQAESYEWISKASRKKDREVGAIRIFWKNQFPFIEIKTEDGFMTAQRGDYVILNAEGEILRFPPGIFEATYEKVEE